MAGDDSADDLLFVTLSAELQSISDSGGLNTSHPSSHDHRLGGTQHELLLPRENLSEQEAHGEVLGKGGAGQNHQQGWSVGGRSWCGGGVFGWWQSPKAQKMSSLVPCIDK